MYQKTYILKICSCLVAKSYPTLWDPMDSSTQASQSLTISQSLFKLMPIESVMPSNHLNLCHPFLLLPSMFPATRSFPMSQLFSSGDHSTGASASASVLPMSTQGWSPLEWTGWISLLSPTPQFKGISSSALSFLYSPTLKSVHDYWKNQ